MLANLGILFANRGSVGGKQIVSQDWIDECAHWGERDQQVRVRYATTWGAGYKAFIWHAKADRSRPYFSGHHGQKVLIDMSTKTVLVQTGLEDPDVPVWWSDPNSMLETASGM